MLVHQRITYIAAPWIRHGSYEVRSWLRCSLEFGQIDSSYPLVMTNIAMENPEKMEVSTGKSSINEPFSMAILNNQRVSFVEHLQYQWIHRQKSPSFSDSTCFNVAPKLGLRTALAFRLGISWWEPQGFLGIFFCEFPAWGLVVHAAVWRNQVRPRKNESLDFTIVMSYNIK